MQVGAVNGRWIFLINARFFRVTSAVVAGTVDGSRKVCARSEFWLLALANNAVGDKLSTLDNPRSEVTTTLKLHA